MGITGGFGILIDLVTGRPRRWYVRADGIKRWVSNDQPCDVANEADLWRCTACGRIGSVGRCCGTDTREPVRTPNAKLTGSPGFSGESVLDAGLGVAVLPAPTFEKGEQA